MQLIPKDIAKKFNVIAALKVGKTLFVATSDPKNVFVLDTLKFVTGMDVQPVISQESSIKEAIEKYYESDFETVGDIMSEMEDEMELLDEEEEEISMRELQEAVNEKPLVKLVNSLILEAIRKQASDIHIEVYEKRFRVRYRIDGELQEAAPLPLKMKAAVISRLKIMARLDISERRHPQDARLQEGGGRRQDEMR